MKKHFPDLGWTVEYSLEADVWMNFKLHEIGELNEKNEPFESFEYLVDGYVKPDGRSYWQFNPKGIYFFGRRDIANFALIMSEVYNLAMQHLPEWSFRYGDSNK